MKKYKPARINVGRKIGHALDATVGTAVGSLSHAIHSTLQITGLTRDQTHDVMAPHHQPVAMPGLEGSPIATRRPPPAKSRSPFLAGIYGMNFEHIPELKHRYAYPIFWGVCGAVTLDPLSWFYRKGWIGPRN